MSTKQDKPITPENLQAALAGESMAHVRYRYFAEIARAHGDEETAKLFEETAAQEVRHAIGHLELLYPRDTLDVPRVLQMAVDGETHEYTEMYPAFYRTALAEREARAAAEFAEQITESQEHAAIFAAMLDKAGKRFAALTRVEQRHAGQYAARLDAVSVGREH